MHVAHLNDNGDGNVYINGHLEGEEHPLARYLKPGAVIWIGGWYDNFDFEGDIDEVRISKVARSPAWIELEYENQKANQTLVGTLPKPGTAFSVSQEKLDILEGQRGTITAQAGGKRSHLEFEPLEPRKLWLPRTVSHARSTPAALKTRLNFTLRFEAVYANDVKQKEIAVTIKKAIPDPKFILQAPAAWDGRGRIEVAPRISNQAEMDAKGAGKLNFVWTVSGGRVDQGNRPRQIDPQAVAIHRADQR